MAGRQVTAAGTRPATPLRLALQANGWSYARLVAALRQAAARRGKQLPKSESLVVMISRWVNGRERPDAFYQELLCEALERLPSELGFKEEPGSLTASAAAQDEPWGLAGPVPASPGAGGDASPQLHASPPPFSGSAGGQLARGQRRS